MLTEDRSVVGYMVWHSNTCLTVQCTVFVIVYSRELPQEINCMMQKFELQEAPADSRPVQLETGISHYLIIPAASRRGGDIHRGLSIIITLALLARFL